MRYQILALLVCVLLIGPSFGQTTVPETDTEKYQSLRAFEPKDPTAVRTAVNGVYAVIGVATIGMAMLFIGWAKFYAPRYWQQGDAPKSIVPRPHRPESKEETSPSTADRDRFELEGDIVDFLTEVDSNHE